MKEKRKSTILEMMKDYLYYGYGFNFFLEQKYEITESFTNEELKVLWEQTKNRLGSEY